MRTKIYEEKTKEEIEIERQRLDVELTYQALLNAHLANQLKEKEEKKMKNKLKKVFTKKEKEAKVYDTIVENWINDEETTLTVEQAEQLLDETHKREIKSMVIMGVACAAGFVLPALLSGMIGEDE